MQGSEQRDREQLASSFPIARCDGCDKDVLAYADFDSEGGERRLCVHCDGAVADSLKWIGVDELEASGYFLGDPLRHKAGACSSGCGSCAVRKA